MNFKNLFAFEKSLGVAMVTPDMQACIYLFLNGPVPSLSLQMNLRISASGFYSVQRRLKDRGVIVGRQCEEDLRVTLYDLAEPVRELMREMFGDPELHRDANADGRYGEGDGLSRGAGSGLRKWPASGYGK